MGAGVHPPDSKIGAFRRKKVDPATTPDYFVDITKVPTDILPPALFRGGAQERIFLA